MLGVSIIFQSLTNISFLVVNIKKKNGRLATKRDDYQAAQMGAGAHLSTQSLNSTQASTRQLGHAKKFGIVSMS